MSACNRQARAQSVASVAFAHLRLARRRLPRTGVSEITCVHDRHLACAGEREEVIQLVHREQRHARPAAVRRTLLHAGPRQLTHRISSWVSRATRQLERAAPRTSRVEGLRDPALRGAVP